MKTDKLIIPNNIDIRDINNNYYDFENNISYYFHDVENPSFNELNNEEKAAIIKDMSFNIDFHGEYNDEYNADLYHTEPLPLQYLKERLDKKIDIKILKDGKKIIILTLIMQDKPDITQKYYKNIKKIKTKNKHL